MLQRTWTTMVALIMLQLLVMAVPHNASAQPAAAAPANESEVCTNFEYRKAELDKNTAGAGSTTAEPGLLSDVYRYIKEVVDGSTKKLFESFINSPAYQKAVFASMALMLIVFAVGFMIGVIQPSFGQVLVRLVKFGIILSIISSTGWNFFNNHVVKFFNDGTDELIMIVTEIGTGQAAPAGSTPFYQFDKVAEYLIQPDTIIAITGSTFAGGPFGLAVGGLMAIAFMAFVQLLIKALRTYAVSYVARSLLLGLGPVFFVFLLFEKTKQLFMTWLNSLVSLMLQPVLLFTFLSFFIVLIQSAATDMLSVEFCWTEYKSSQGTTNKTSMWRAVDAASGNPIRSEFSWKGAMECIVSGKTDCPEFPINIVDTLSFLILVYIASRFAGVVERIANELANTYIALDAGGRLDQFMQTNKQSAGQGAADVVTRWRGANPSSMGKPR